MNNKKIYTSESELEDITKYDSDIRSEYSSETDLGKEEQDYRDKYATAKPRRIIIKARLIND